MPTQRKISALLMLAWFAAPASAGTIVYVSTFTGQFGTMDAATGTFTQIGPSFTDPLGGLVQGGPTGYMGVSFSGNLDSVNPATGTISVIGATGLGSAALDTAELNGTVYETDYGNNLYTINTTTGAASLIGPTGMPPVPSDPADLVDEAFFGADGKLYATFDAFNATTYALVDPPELYQINTTTGLATLVAPTAFQLDAAVDLGGTIYGFTAADTVLSLDLATGGSTFVTNYDPAAFFVTGVAQTPEPASFTLAGIGIAAVLIARRRRRHS
jgi:PEP-CTERM motif